MKNIKIFIILIIVALFNSIFFSLELKKKNKVYDSITDISWKWKYCEYWFYLNEFITPIASLLAINYFFNKIWTCEFEKFYVSFILICIIRFFIGQITVLPPINKKHPVRPKYLTFANQIIGNDYIFSGHICHTFIFTYFISKKLAFILSILQTITASMSRQHYSIDGVFAIIISHYTIIHVDKAYNKIICDN